MRAIVPHRIAQAEPGDAEGDQQHEDVLPFFADDACRARIIGDELRSNSLKPSDDFGRMQRYNNQRNSDSNDERCDQRTLHARGLAFRYASPLPWGKGRGLR